MSHKIQAILERVRRYQLPIWQYQSLPILDPYLLSSIGYVPIAADTIQCSICLKEVSISQEKQGQPQKLRQQLLLHDQNCIYNGEECSAIGKEELYLAMEEISTELNERSTAERYPLLRSDSIWSYTEKDRFLLKKVMRLYQIDCEKFNISFFLRLFGWYFSKNGENVECLACYFCGRMLQVEQFRTIETTTQEGEIEATTDQEKLFDPIESHRYFCMWAGREANWLVFLQELQDKYAEYLSFRLKVQPLSAKKMKIHIDKYLETFNQKIQASVLKLKQVGEEFDRLCHYLGEEKVAELSEESMRSDRKRIRDLQSEMQLIAEGKGNVMSKKLKTD